MIDFRELINIKSLKKISENIYEIAGIMMAIADTEGRIEFVVGRSDICSKFHRVNETSCKHCLDSDKYINNHIKDGKHIIYKCLNNMWDVAIPIVISNMHIATILFGQFFYDDEVVDIEYFRSQAHEYGFNEKEYLEALSKVPILSREKVDYIIEYFKGLIMTLAESGLRQLEYKNSQKDLEKSQKYLHTIFNSVNDAIFIQDLYGNILDVNQTAISMFGYNRDEFINMNIISVTQKNLQYPNLSILDILNNVRNTNKHHIIECMCRSKDNREFWVEINIRSTNIEGDKRIISVLRDVTERKKNELALQNEAIELEKLRTEFFANISHELRTPLNIILGTIKINSINLEKDKIDRGKIINNINIERQNCLRLLRLINNLIDSTKLDSGYLELRMVNCNIISLVEEITLSVSQYIHSNNLTLTFDTEIEEKIIACDLDKIERIILNVLSNAIKFTRPGGDIFVNIYDGEEFITISIEDTGVGIAEDKLSVIFDRFRQVDRSFIKNQDGSGIGLSLVKSLVEIQGGKVSVQSKCGVGTKFLIKLPIKLVDSNSEVNFKLFDNNLNDRVERIKIEFSDIYSL